MTAPYTPPPGEQQPYAPPPYGYQQPYAPPQYGYQPVLVAAPSSGAATASLIFGILSYVFLPVIGAIVAVICGHVAIGQIRTSGNRVGGKGMAIAGLILGYLQIVGVVLFVIFVVILGVAIAGSGR
ncbi:MAG: DUF4190 domain-containing protein [Chloroflexota bacterium]|nr:DUF4190 domain-containing protein [Chloroflexota bacterium]